MKINNVSFSSGNLLNQMYASAAQQQNNVQQEEPSALQPNEQSLQQDEQQQAAPVAVPSQIPSAAPASKLDVALKYAGVVALVAVPVVGIVNHRNMSKTLKVLQETSAQQIKVLQDAIKENGQQITQATSKSANSVVETLKTLVPAGIGGTLGAVISGAVKTSKETETSKVNLSEELINQLTTESTKRVEGAYPWKQLDNVKGWMVTAEHTGIIKTGGLADVAQQLPDEFNKKYAADPNNRLDVIMPLYLSRATDAVELSLRQIDDNKFIYKFTPDKKEKDGSVTKGKEITLEKTHSFKMDAFNKINRFDEETVDVLTGEVNGTKMMFLKNDKYFNITPDSSKIKPTPYVYSERKIGEVERMVFMSKAVYEMMKLVKGTDNEPTTVIANDWHTGAISGAMRYVAPVENETKKIDDEMMQYIKDIPVIHITHNSEFQGNEQFNDVAHRITKTLLGKDCDLYSQYLAGYDKDGCALTMEDWKFNEAYIDMNLADMVLAVSPNYKRELLSRSLGSGMEKLSLFRQDHGTMDGILNGYTKSLAAANEQMVKGINGALDTKLVAYDENGYDIKMQNKAKVFELLNKFAKGAKVPGATLYKNDKCAIPADVDVSKTPLLVSVGRFDNQKGFDYMADSIVEMYKKLPPGEEIPVFAVLGSAAGEDKTVERLLNGAKDRVAKFNPKAAERMFVFTGFSGALRDALGIASDFFLIPSKWEPCGLTQMEAMPKGSLPIATSTGGLVDTIVDGTDGFLTDVFYGFKYPDEKLFVNKKIKPEDLPKGNIEAFTETMNRALKTYYDEPEKIKEMAKTAMQRDFSWDLPGGSLDKYDNLFRTGRVA